MLEFEPKNGQTHFITGWLAPSSDWKIRAFLYLIVKLLPDQYDFCQKN
jgi:hypothetical protein